ncbi:MAG: hypothetical protein ACR2HG_05985 [Pyrinomonadaceae bacterium]
MIKPEDMITLSIESGIERRTVAVSNKAGVIDFRSGTKEFSKTEYILEQIEKLLSENAIKKEAIGFIEISDESNSSTGGKANLAIALGLNRALNSAIILKQPQTKECV